MKADERAKGLSARRVRGTRSRKSKGAQSTSSGAARNFKIKPQEVSVSWALETLKPHDHLCLIYESTEEWRTAAIPFISIGLKQGEKCIYIMDVSTADEIRKYLSEEGIDVVSAETTGQLSLLHQTEAYTRGESFDPDKMIALLISETERAIAEGYQVLRVTGEMTWVLRGHPGSEKLLEYEAKLNSDFFFHYPCLAICQYDRWKFDPEIIKGVVMTHPLLIRGNRVYHNFYYVPPQEFLYEKRAEREVQHWLNNLERENIVQWSLHESENRYFELFNNMSSGVAVYKAANDGQDFIFVDFNRGGEYIDKIRRDKVIGKSVLDVFPGVRDFGLFEVFQRVWRTGTPEHYPITFYRDNRISGWRYNYIYKLSSGELVAVYDDITERKEMEEELRQREEFLDNVIKQTPNAMWISDAHGTVVAMNQALRDLLKITDKQIIGNYNVFKDSQVIEQGLLPLVKSVFEKGKTVNFTIDYYTGREKQVKLERKTHKILDLTMSAVKNKEGTVINVICQHRDITALKQAEAELKHARQEWEHIFQAIGHPTVLLDAEQNIVNANLATVGVTGKSVSELVGKKCWEVFHLTAQPAGCPFKKMLASGNMVTTEMMIETLGGVYLVSCTPMLDADGKLEKVIHIATDISELKQAENALRESEEKYRTLFETMTQGVVYQDADGHIFSANPAAERILGLTLDQMQGKTSSDPGWKAIHEDGSDFPGETHPSMIALRTGKEVLNEIMGIFHPGRNEHVWISIHAVPLFKPGEMKPYQVYTTFIDITGRRRAQAERMQFEQKAQLTSRLASVGEMAAGVAHEINNPLTGVVGYAQLLMARKDIPPDIRKDLEAINTGAQRVAGIIQRLLAFSRQTRPERKLVDINDLVENTLILRAYHLRVNNIDVITHLAHESLLTMVDPGQIQQVFLNLVVNAETAIKLACGKGRLTITTEKTDTIIKICVQDNGPGIKLEIMDRIFDPFFTTREAGQGTGLGLSLCYGIVAEHGGRIYAESTFGDGATFVIELPAIGEVKKGKPARTGVEKPRKKVNARILVVDDEKIVRDIVNRVLTDDGHTVEVVDNAIAALSQIEGMNYDLIMVDIKMPGMSGTTLYRHIQNIDESLVKRLVFITGDIMGEDTRKFLADTGVAYIEKPFDAGQLSKKVARALHSVK